MVDIFTTVEWNVDFHINSQKTYKLSAVQQCFAMEIKKDHNGVQHNVQNFSSISAFSQRIRLYLYTPILVYAYTCRVLVPRFLPPSVGMLTPKYLPLPRINLFAKRRTKLTYVRSKSTDPLPRMDLSNPPNLVVAGRSFITRTPQGI